MRPNKSMNGAVEPNTGESLLVPESLDSTMLEETMVSHPPRLGRVSVAPYDLRVLRALRRIIRAVDLHSRKLSSKHKITGPQLVCLLTIQDREPVTVSSIAHGVHLSASTVIGILDRLEAKGYVRRERGIKDRRLVHVSLTEPGKALVERAPSPLQDKLADAMNGLHEDEQATIAESLERIVELMEVRDMDAAPMLETGPIAPSSDDGH